VSHAVRLAGVLLVAVSCAACARPEGNARQTTAASATPAASAQALEAAVEGAACGGAGCRRFTTPAQALRAVLAENPRVLAVGEAHAQQGIRVRSAAARFKDELLPLLRGRATHLVLEIWLQTGKCGKVERRVREQQRPVVTSQAPQNLDEFVALGTRAKALGIEPHALVPSCQEYDVISKAGASDIARMLEMITARTERDIVRLLDAGERDAGRSGLIVAYGGGLHNDVEPRTGREAWSFGPALTRRTAGRYVELDLIVPELIKESEAWRAQRWYAHYDATQAGASTLLYNPAPRSYALILPRQ
jgi:hypothetical protein